MTNEKKKVIGVYLAKHYRDKVIERAKRNRRSVSTEVAMIIEKELSNDKKK